MESPVKNVLIKSAYAIIRALAKILLKQGIGYAVFSEIARGAFVEAATEFEIKGRQLSDSRISVITGLSRKEVRRLKNKGVEGYIDDGSRHNRAVRIITAWNREKEYLTRQNKPRVLPLYGNSPSLQTLVAEFGRGVPVKAVVDELARVGAIRETRQGFWRLENPAYVPKASDETVMKILGADVPLLIKTINFNLDAELNEKRFQRKVCYQGITDVDASRFKVYAAGESFKLLKKLDKWLARAVEKRTIINKTKNTENSIGVSVFYFEEHEDHNND